MKTNYLMLKDLLEIYTPEQRGIVSTREFMLIKDTLCLDEMDVLSLRNLRDFTVIFISNETDSTRVDWDKMSAITYVIDTQIVEMGGEV